MKNCMLTVKDLERGVGMLAAASSGESSLKKSKKTTKEERKFKERIASFSAVLSTLPFCSLELSDEVAVMDFMVDTILRDPSMTNLVWILFDLAATCTEAR